MRKRISLLQMAVFFFTAQVAWAGNIKTEKVTLVGNGIVEFIPVGYDVSRTPSLILSHEPEKKGEVPENWKLVPQFTMTDGKANASLDVPAGTSLYGGGEVTGPLLRNGQKIKMWNTDNGMYRVDGGSRLYQTHPWVLGVRPDGTAFGVLFDSFWKAELITNSDKIEFNTEGAPFRTYIIDRESPQAVLKGLAELTGTISMPPRWAIGYHQSRFSYVPEARVKEVANTFREKKIPCDVIWFDINYMDEFRVFTINDRDFPDPKRMNKYLHDNGFHSVYMIDINEPSVFDGPGGTMPENNIHLGGGNLPIGSHLMYHNAYGRLMVEASYNGMMAANPGKRPFLLSRSNIIGGQRYAAMWTGDNEATYEHMKLSIPMSITLGLSGQPFNGPDIGGFAGNTTPDLWGNWLGFGAFFPFSRGHASCDTNNKEPWAFTKDIEKESRMALERRYRLLPYLYTAFHVAHKDGQPVMAPVFFADPKDESLRAEEQAFMLGTDLLIIPAFAKNPSLPKGIWENLSLVKGDTKGKYQAKLKVRGGSIIPVGKIIQNVNENSFDPLTLVVCPDEDGKAEGSLYWDKGDGWGFQKGDYKQLTFKAELVDGHHLIVKVTDDKGEDQIDFGMIKVEVLHAGHTYKSSGDIAKGITVNL